MSTIKGLISKDWKDAVPGLILCILFAILCMNLDHWLKGLDQAGVGWAHLIYTQMQITYVAMLLLGGLLIRNVFGIPKVFLRGVAAARPIIKPGIVILGVHYVLLDVLKVGGIGLALVTIFIFGTALAVMYLGRRMGASDGLSGIMAAGTGICGVSAIIATAPVVRAKPRDMAYAIGTILLFGTLMLFIFPYIGRALNLSEPQFGAWVAVAILNTAQLIAAAEWYGVAARDTAVLINAARIIFIPIVVMVATWFYCVRGNDSKIDENGRPEAAVSNEMAKVDRWQLMKDKFPVFILGFFVLVVLNTLGIGFLGGPKIEGSAFWAMDAVHKWFFAVGFAGIGMMISIEDMKKAGGKAFLIGFGAASAKMVLGLLAVYLIGTELLTVGI